MPEYLSPGVYIEEISGGVKPIEGVSTSTAGIVGAAERGPAETMLITSWLEYQRWYGGYVFDVSYMPHAVEGFFNNGGQRIFVRRVGGGQATTGPIGNLTGTAVGAGDWGDQIWVRVDDATQPAADKFRLALIYYRVAPPLPLVDPLSPDPDDLVNPNRREPTVVEVYDNLTFTEGASNNVVKVVNANSKLVRLAWNADQARPANQAFTALGANGATTAPTVDDFRGGLTDLELIDEISLLLLPDASRGPLAPLTDDVINQCSRLKDRFAILAVPEDSPRNPVNVQVPADSSYGAIYYPWVEVYDPSIDAPRVIPPVGHVAGVYARTDIERGVHKAPANEVARSVRQLEFPVSKGMQDLLNPRGINCLRDFRSDGRGIRVWGARTMSSDPEWKYVNVRRLFLFVEESIEEGTQWVVFEPNDEPTWAKVRRSISNFLITIWRNGALMGLTQDEAFFVKCDRTTMTPDDIDNGRLICYIGIAPVKPAEFVIFRISQKTLEAQA
jgi:phage tail sheath protein FI